jgi:hypothetical protein
MRLLVFTVVLFALAANCIAAKNETVAQLKTRFESARPEDRAELGIRIAQLQLRNADALYNKGNAEQARIAVEDIATYAEKARDAAEQTQKHLKNVEIDARKMADKLRDIKRTLSVDDQPPVEQAIRRLEDVRTTLLKTMFAKKEKK